jgi:hypothetical protein
MITIVIGILESRVIAIKTNTQSQMAHDPFKKQCEVLDILGKAFW